MTSVTRCTNTGLARVSDITLTVLLAVGLRVGIVSFGDFSKWFYCDLSSDLSWKMVRITGNQRKWVPKRDHPLFPCGRWSRGSSVSPQFRKLLYIIYQRTLFEASTTDFQICESFHTICGQENSLLHMYTSSYGMASTMSLLSTKRGDMLRQLITHVPDLVVNRLMDSKMEPPILEKTYGILAFADVSGSY